MTLVLLCSTVEMTGMTIEMLKKILFVIFLSYGAVMF